MTQTQTLTTLATRPSSGKKGWTLSLFDPLGQELLATYDSATNPGPIHEGFNSRRYPNNTCGPGSFMAIPKHLIGGDPRNITQLTYDTGTRIVPVHFGYIGRAPDPRKGNVSKYELVSGKELLKNSYCDQNAKYDNFTPIDVANFLRVLVSFYRHPALKYDPNRIPLTGVVAANVDARGTNLYEALKAIISSVPSLKDNDWGVDPEGYVVIQPASGSYTFEGDDAAIKYGERDGEQVCTKATIRLVKAVSDGAIVSAGYRPSFVEYSYTDPAHQIYSAPRSFDLPERDDGTPILEVLEYLPSSGFTWRGDGTSWTSSVSGKTVPVVAQDGDLGSYAYPASGSPGQLSSGEPTVVGKFTTVLGGALVIDAPAGDYTLMLTVHFQALTSANANQNLADIKFDVSNVKGQGKVEVRVIAPPPLTTGSFVSSTGSFALDIIGIAPTSLKVYELRGLRANTTLLEQIAQSNIRLPARQVSQVTFARSVLESGQILGGYLLETPVKTLIVKGEDGNPISCEVTEYNDTCTATEGMLTRAETGEPIRNPIVNTINDAIRRAQEAYS